MPYWRLFYHFVWGTKRGEPFIQPAWARDLHNVIAAKATDLEAVVHAVGGIDNHVHLVVSIPPKIALSTFIGQVKGHTSHWINHSLSPDHAFAWQGEYGVVSFDATKLDRIVQYVHNQPQHHAARTLIHVLERIAPPVTSLHPPP